MRYVEIPWMSPASIKVIILNNKEKIKKIFEIENH